MKADGIFMIVAIIVIIGILFVWWITIQEGQRILSPDNTKDVVYANNSAKAETINTERCVHSNFL